MSRFCQLLLRAVPVLLTLRRLGPLKPTRSCRFATEFASIRLAVYALSCFRRYERGALTTRKILIPVPFSHCYHRGHLLGNNEHEPGSEPYHSLMDTNLRSSDVFIAFNEIFVSDSSNRVWSASAIASQMERLQGGVTSEQWGYIALVVRAFRDMVRRHSNTETSECYCQSPHRCRAVSNGRCNMYASLLHLALRLESFTRALRDV